MKSPKLYGGRIPCALYLEPEIFDIIEEHRGKKSRNSFLIGIIEKSIKSGVL